MPIRDYKCSACGETWEVFLIRSDDQEPTECPKCHAPTPERQQVSLTGFRLMGDGWFKKNLVEPALKSGWTKGDKFNM